MAQLLWKIVQKVPEKIKNRTYATEIPLIIGTHPIEFKLS